MIFTDLFESFDDTTANYLEIGDPVIITGPVQYRGKTGDIVDFGRDKNFVIVDLYNHGKHSFHSSDVSFNEYAGSEEEESDWQEREDYGTFGDDERDEDLNEGFGAYYYEQLAQKVFDKYPDLSTKGGADELLDTGWKIAAQDLGVKRANWEFNYDEDFPSDFVSAYGWLQSGGLEEGWKQNLAALGAAAALGAGGMAAMGGSAPTTGGPEIVNPNQVVQMIKAGKIANSGDLQAVLSKAKNKNQVWLMLQNAADMQGSSDADAVVQTIAGVREGVAEGSLNEGLSTDQLAGMIAARLERLAPNVFTDYGIEYVLDAVRDVAEFYAMSDFEELGSSDLGAMARSVVKQLKMREAHMNKGA